MTSYAKLFGLYYSWDMYFWNVFANHDEVNSDAVRRYFSINPNQRADD